MSAWRVGTESASDRGSPTPAANDDGVDFGPPSGPPTGGDDAVATALDGLTKWIPGDVLALYMTAVTIFAASDGSKPSPALLLAFALVSAAFVLAGAFAKTSNIERSTLTSALLALLAFVIWSISVPFSGWQRWDLISDNQAAAALIAAVVGLLFGLIAQGLTRERTD